MEEIITRAEYKKLPMYRRNRYDCWALKGDVIKVIFRLLTISIPELQAKLGINPREMHSIIMGKKPICVIALNALRSQIEELSGNTIPKTMIARCLLK